MFRRPVSPFVENMENLHLSAVYLIRHKVRGAGNNQLEAVGNAAFAAQEGKLDELADLLLYVCIYRQSCQHIALGDVVQEVVFLCNRFR